MDSCAVEAALHLDHLHERKETVGTDHTTNAQELYLKEVLSFVHMV
jgi:hypothetical protein